MLKLKLNFKQPDIGPPLSDSEVMHGLRTTRDRRSRSISSADHFNARSAATGDSYLDSEPMAFSHPGRGKTDYNGRMYDPPGAGRNPPFSRSEGRRSMQRSWSQEPGDEKSRGTGYSRSGYDPVQSSEFGCEERNAICGRPTGRPPDYDMAPPGYGCYGNAMERLPRSHNPPPPPQSSSSYWTSNRHDRSGCERPTHHARGTGEEIGRSIQVRIHLHVHQSVGRS